MTYDRVCTGVSVVVPGALHWGRGHPLQLVHCCLLFVIDYTIRCRQYYDVGRIQGEWVRNPNFPWNLLDDSLWLWIVIRVTGERAYVCRPFQ